MASVWKRLQRVNKRAAKFQYTASYHRVDLETSPKWKPNKLSVVWTRRSRRVLTEPAQWEPSLKDPLKGSVLFTAPENHSVAVTLFKDSRTNELEDKDWTFVLEDVSVTGKRRRLAVCALNMRKYASLEPSQRPLMLTLEPTTHKIVAASVQLTLHCVLLREGQATDEDMQSLASLLSVNNNSDIAVLEDLDEDDYTLSDHSTKQMSDLRQQMEEMTQSLTNSDIAATPNSVQSLNFDNSRTPTAPITPEMTTPVTPVPVEVTPTIDTSLKITDPPITNKTKTEFLTNLTKMSTKTETPKFTSTPNKITTQNSIENKPELKGIVFKTKTLSKRNLKPLELKTNLNSIGLDKNDNEEEDFDKTPTGEIDKVFPVKGVRDKTPVQDLLEWCQSATREYKSCRITNLTTSFRSGLAFCAIIHSYRPDLIDFSGLQPDDAEKNLRVALEASATLGISQVLTAADVCARPTPDRLAIMTYLFQLRAHFTGNELQVEQLGNDETESSYMVGRHDTDGSLPQELFSREVSTRRSRTLMDRPRPVSQESQESRKSQERSTPDKLTPPPIKDVRDLFLHQSKTILGKMLSPARDYKDKPSAKWFDDPVKINEPPIVLPEKLMTRKELTDPFGSDEEEEDQKEAMVKNQDSDSGNTDTVKTDSVQPTLEPTFTDPLTNNQQLDQQTENIRKLPNCTENRFQTKQTTPELPKPTPQLLSRHDELKERARQLLEATRREAREKDRIRKQNSKEKEENNKEIVNGLRNGEISPKKPMSDEERQAMLRERARKLIADARAGILSPTSPTSPARPRTGAVEIISKQSVMEELAAAGGMEQLDMMLSRSDSIPSSPGSRKSNSVSPDRCEEVNGEENRSVKSAGSRRSPLHSFTALVDRLTPDKQDINESDESGSYIQSELEALEREQAAIDVKAAALEKRLRTVMESADNTEEEDRLMTEWFNLVNKKNALLRRQMQLNILEQEEDLSRRCELLARELRLSLGVDEWRKTPGQKRRERLLLQELISAVNERDRLVQEMDEQERAIADDDKISRDLSNVEIQRKNNCRLQ